MERSFFIVGLGASAGGQSPLVEFLKHIHSDIDAAFIVVTHLWRYHKTQLDKILSRACAWPVTIVRNGQRIESKRVYIMPENVQLTIHKGIAWLTLRPEYDIVNRSIDIFFTSLAEDQREKAIGVIFSGSGSDGAQGIQRIHQLNGRVYIQDPHSARFASMPEAAIRANHPDVIDTPAVLAKAISKIVANGSLQFSD